jgi:hypothetical protein
VRRYGNASTTSNTNQKQPSRVRTRKGESAMAKLHARPSNQYRYEHYDPRVLDAMGL